MAFRIEAKIEGLPELVKQLREELPRRMQGTILRKALRKSCKKVIASARMNLRKSKRTGQLSKSIGAKIKIYRTTGNAVGIVGPRRGFKVPMTQFLQKERDKFFKRAAKSGPITPATANALSRMDEKIADSKQQFIDPAMYAHLVEKGAKSHTITLRRSVGSHITINHPGSPARPFLRPALDNNRAAILQAFESEIRAGLAAHRSTASESGTEETISG